MKIIIAGDLCPHSRIKTLFEQNQFGDAFSDVQPMIADADYSVVNLETAIVDNKPYKATSKWSPNLGNTTNAIEAVKSAGFKCVTLANNHFRDYGNESVKLAIDTLTKESIDYVGGGNNIVEAKKVLFKNIGGKTIAFINFCEHEGSIASDVNGGCAPLDVVENYYQIQEAKSSSDYVIVIVHGGHEHYQLPSPRMQQTYRFFVNAGADVVVNHHQHCFSGYEVYNGKHIFYGLGNFCFDNGSTSITAWNYGAMLNMEMIDSIKFTLIPYRQCAKVPRIELLNGAELNDFETRMSELNAVILNTEELEKKHRQYCKDRFQDMRMCLAPYTNRILYSLALRKLLPSFNSRKRLLRALDYIECESHRDVFIEYLKNNID